MREETGLIQEALQFEKNRVVDKAENKVDSNSFHFWVARNNLFRSVLFVPPHLEDSSNRVLATLFDSSGEEINTISAEFPRAEVGMLELEHLMHRCKLESGIQHGHLAVSLGGRGVPFVRLLGDSSSSIMGAPEMFDSTGSAFFPLIFSDVRHSYLTIINTSSESGVLAVRLFVGKRSPEILCSVPARGSKIINLGMEFPDFVSLHSEREQRCYVRVRSRAAGKVGVQLIECDQLDESGVGCNFFSVS